MSERITRRELARRGLIGMAALATPSALFAQTPEEPKTPIPTSDLDKIEKQLAKPMPPEARKLLEAAVQNNRGNGASRMKFKVVDGAEPATIYFAKESGGRPE